MAFRPTLDQLRVIIAVADAGTFSAAARQLGRVQPAITQSVKTLEAGTQIAIFDRRGKTVRLTEAGELMVARSREAIAAVDALCDEAQRLSSGLESELSIAIDGGVPRSAVTSSLKLVSETFPGLRVAVFTEGFGGAEQLVREGLVQVGVYFALAETSRSGLVRDSLGTLELIPVASAGHPLAAMAQDEVADGLRDHVQLIMADRARLIAPVQGSIMSSRTWVFSEYGTRLDCLRAGLGWGHVLKALVTDELTAGTLKALKAPGDFTKTDLYVYHRLGHPPARAGRLFLSALARFLRELEHVHAGKG